MFDARLQIWQSVCQPWHVVVADHDPTLQYLLDGRVGHQPSQALSRRGAVQLALGQAIDENTQVKTHDLTDPTKKSMCVLLLENL